MSTKIWTKNKGSKAFMVEFGEKSNLPNGKILYFQKISKTSTTKKFFSSSLTLYGLSDTG